MSFGITGGLNIQKIFAAEVEAAYERDEKFLTKLASVKEFCNEQAQGMHIDFRIVSPEQLRVIYHGSPNGILAQGEMDFGVAKRQDGLVLLSVHDQEDAFEMDAPQEEVLSFLMQAIARKEALNGAYKVVCSQYSHR
jgi:hypothetical protein